MTIKQLADLNKKNEGCFFIKEHLKANGERLSDFIIEDYSERAVRVYRKQNPNKVYYFLKATGRIVHFICDL